MDLSCSLSSTQISTKSICLTFSQTPRTIWDLTGKEEFTEFTVGLKRPLFAFKFTHLIFFESIYWIYSGTLVSAFVAYRVGVYSCSLLGILSILVWEAEAWACTRYSIHWLIYEMSLCIVNHFSCSLSLLVAHIFKKEVQSYMSHFTFCVSYSSSTSEMRKIMLPSPSDEINRLRPHCCLSIFCSRNKFFSLHAHKTPPNHTSLRAPECLLTPVKKCPWPGGREGTWLYVCT